MPCKAPHPKAAWPFKTVPPAGDRSVGGTWFFMCIGILSACLCEGVSFPGLELQVVVSCYVGAGLEPRPSALNP